MEFGIYLNQYGDDERGSTIHTLLEQVSEIETLGYDTAAVGERHFYEDGFQDVFSSLTAMATQVDDLELMANILILPIYHPVHLAERISAIDHLADGKTRWGVSLGYRESELVNFGVGMDQRVSRFIECLEVLKRLLEGERFDHDGDHYQFTDGFVRPTPVQSPRPKIWGGGSAETAIKRAAYRCDGFTAAVTDPDRLEADIERYRDSLAEFKTDPDDGDVTIMVDGYVGETTAAAYEALDPSLLDLTAKYIRWGNPEFDGRPGFGDLEAQTMIGSADEVAENVALYRDIGVDHLIFRTQFPGMDDETAMESVRRFATDVVPTFR
ncbi:LLM class flavin-dependent oxidoreductase [Natrononativus amylolyticus]|uniref:LLM class flavin-dependent oxidoreductase n=1 Tax=Natrononativus amylolyticus TaxID=2963434 RepID=UPI0020CE0559|nr:LLM class flavin-dependent oxidoreductase [Natrononativus amylolyticus]